jgi:hypothetical protein
MPTKLRSIRNVPIERRVFAIAGQQPVNLFG